MKINIKIPVKPLSVNKAWAGRRFKSTYYKDFENDVCNFLPFAKKTITEECEVHYTFFVKNYKMTDIDNLIKTIQDIIIKRGYIKDDRQIVYLLAEKVQSNEEAIEVDILEI